MGADMVEKLSIFAKINKYYCVLHGSLQNYKMIIRS